MVCCSGCQSSLLLESHIFLSSRYQEILLCFLILALLLCSDYNYNNAEYLCVMDNDMFCLNTLSCRCRVFLASLVDMNMRIQRRNTGVSEVGAVSGGLKQTSGPWQLKGNFWARLKSLIEMFSCFRFRGQWHSYLFCGPTMSSAEHSRFRA